MWSSSSDCRYGIHTMHFLHINEKVVQIYIREVNFVAKKLSGDVPSDAFWISAVEITIKPTNAKNNGNR